MFILVRYLPKDAHARVCRCVFFFVEGIVVLWPPVRFRESKREY